MGLFVSTLFKKLMNKSNNYQPSFEHIMHEDVVCNNNWKRVGV